MSRSSKGWREGSSALRAPLLSLSGDTATRKLTTATTRELTATRKLFVRRDGRSPADGATGEDGAGWPVGSRQPARGSGAGAVAGTELAQDGSIL